MIAGISITDSCYVLSAGRLHHRTPVWNIDSTVAAGVYSLTAVATDSNNLTATSAAVNVTVNSATLQTYFIHTDQLDTPRVITDGNGNAVGSIESDPIDFSLTPLIFDAALCMFKTSTTIRPEMPTAQAIYIRS